MENPAAILASRVCRRVCSNCVNVAYGPYGIRCCEYNQDVSDYDAVECESYVSVYKGTGK